MGSVSFRVATGDSDESEQEGHFSIATYEPGDTDIEEMKAAAVDPERIQCVTELGSSHVVSIRTELDNPTKLLYNNFIDEMFNQLAKPYITDADETVHIKASRATVGNIAKACAQARLLDLNLARRTRGFFVEPECLLTITVPTGLPRKDIYKGEHSGTYISYHKTSWESVAKILVENCVRPASWAKNEAGIPMQFPCYGFFGYSFEIADPQDLKPWPIRVCTSNLYKIGKGQNPSGILATCRSPKLIRAQSWGNDQIQRLCAIAGIAKGKDGATAMNSKCASVSYVASTHPVFPQLITKAPIPIPVVLHLQLPKILQNLRRSSPLLQLLLPLPPLKHPRHRTQPLTIEPEDQMIAVHIQLNPTDMDIIGNLTHPGIELLLGTMVVPLLIEKDALVTITVKDLRGTTPRTVMLIDPAGDLYIRLFLSNQGWLL